jgi:phosphoglycerate dehydrogenase-like enzyme
MILLMYSNLTPTPGHLARLGALAGNRPVEVATSEAEAIALAPGAKIILGHRYLRQALPFADQVRWVQSTAAGMDQIITPELRHRAPVLTRAPVANRTIALHALAMVLALVRRLTICGIRQRQGNAAPGADLLPMPRRALVLGLGEIGQAIATLLRCLGIHVVGAARRPNPVKEQSCDQLLIGEAWRDHLGMTDLLVITLPLTDATHGLIDTRVVTALPSHAIVVNVGRGALLDWPALSAALLSGRLGGLAVDAIDEIPDAYAPIRQAANFLLTPKIASRQPGFQSDLETYVEAQVSRYLNHEPLLNIVEYLEPST